MIFRFIRAAFAAALFSFLSPSVVYGGEISVLSYNLWNYFVEGDYSKRVKPVDSRDAVAAAIAKSGADIVLVSEIGGANSMDDLKRRLSEHGAEYPFSTFMHGSDLTRALGVFAKFAPVEVQKLDPAYLLRPKKAPKSSKPNRVPVQRGFLHLVFERDGYRLHIVLAHLKSRIYHSVYSHSDMRRYEARLLRGVVSDILKKDPAANILVAGDFNDTKDSGAIAAIRGDTLKESMKLVDLRPLDADGCCWTHWWKREDSYGRIDYAFASPKLLPEIEKDKNRIVQMPFSWLKASDHRPIEVFIDTDLEKTQAKKPVSH